MTDGHEHFYRGVQKTTRRLFIINNEIPSSISCCYVSKAGHMPPGKKRANKKGVNNRIKGKTKYGVMVPRICIQAVALDKRNGNTLWQNAVEKEMAALIHHE